MAIEITHATEAVGTEAGNGEIGKTAWNEAHTVTGLATVAETGSYSDLSGTPGPATTSVAGLVELATNAETQTGSDSARAVTPAGLASTIGEAIQGYSSLLDAVAALSLSGNAGKAIVVNPAGDGFVLAEAGGGGMKKHAEGYINGASVASGTGRDVKYFDVTVDAVPDVDKVKIEFFGSIAGNQSSAGAYGGDQSTLATGIVSGRMLTSTTLRLSTQVSGFLSHISGLYIIWDMS